MVLSPRTMSFHAWKLLSHNLVRRSVARKKTLNAVQTSDQDKPITVPMAMLRYSEEILNPPCDLSVYIAPLRDLEQGLIYLCIDNVSRFGTNQLLHLSELPRLAALEIIDREPANQTSFDRLARAWMTRPDRERQFNRLRLLKITLGGQATMTEDSLDYLFDMRLLEILDVTARPAARWHRARDIAEARREGWGVVGLDPESPLFVSYATACLDGRTAVNKRGVAGLWRAFEDDPQKVALTDPPEPLTRRPFDDDGWAAVLRGEHALSAADNTRGLSANDVFWLLALLDQIDTQNGTRNGSDYEAPKRPIYAQMAGISVPEQQFVSLRLREPGGHALGDLSSDWLLFYRARGRSGNPEAGEAPQPRRPHASKAEPAPSWAARPDDRRETGLKARKRQKLGDIFSGFG